MTTIQVTTIPATSVPAGQVQITQRRNAKKDEVIAPENRSRSIIIPELTVEGCSSKFVQLILNALYRIAQDQLSELWDASSDGLKEVPANLWNIDALLLYSARKAESQRLSKETILDWFKTSKLAAFLAAKFGDKAAAVQKKYSEALGKLAAPTVDLTEDQCNQLIASIGKHDEDSESQIGEQMIRRLQSRIEVLKKQREALEELPDLEALA